MKSFLRRFAPVVLGVLSGFDRVVFKGRLPQLYSPEGMNCYASANHVLLKDFKTHARAVTQRVLDASRVASAKAAGRYQYLAGGHTSKDAAARAILERHPVAAGLAAVLQCVEPCWTFDTKSRDGRLTIVGEQGKCSALYHYFRHPTFGWMYVRLQTWFPFEVQIGLNGREWLAHQMDREGLGYTRSDNKFLRVDDWARAQALLTAQLRTDWAGEFDALVTQVHPLHPHHLGRLPVRYNWTVHQSEWATDVAFRSRDDLEGVYTPWVRHGFLTYTSLDAMRFLGRSKVPAGSAPDAHADVERFEESVRLKHWANGNSLKLYDHGTVLRVETTVNNPKEFRSYRSAVGDPDGAKGWRVLQRSVADTHRRAEVSQAANARYLESLAAVKAPATLAASVGRWCERADDPGSPGRRVRALNPLGTADRVLLTAVSDPRWLATGLRNRDLAEALYGPPPADAAERKRQSARVTRHIRLLRAHGILRKVPKSHRYQVSEKARDGLVAVLAAAQATTEDFTEKAA